MNRLFNYENGLMQTLAKAFDCVWLDILWMICCIPIFTIGASSAAYYYAYNKVVRQRRSYVTKEFFAGFKLNFKQSTKAWLIVMLVYVITIYDCLILTQLRKSVSWANILMIIMMALVVFITMWVLYLFPYIARFENSLKATMKNCAIILLANAPWTLLLTVIFAVAIVLFAILPGIGFFSPILYVIFANLILERVFRKYMTPEDLEAEKEIEMFK